MGIQLIYRIQFSFLLHFILHMIFFSIAYYKFINNFVVYMYFISTITNNYICYISTSSARPTPPGPGRVV